MKYEFKKEINTNFGYVLMTGGIFLMGCIILGGVATYIFG